MRKNSAFYTKFLRKNLNQFQWLKSPCQYPYNLANIPIISLKPVPNLL